MAIIRIKPAGDLAIVNGQQQFVEGPDFVRQKMACRFKFFLAEWFLDKRQGVPYYRDVFRKNPDTGVIRSVFRRVVIGTPGVASVPRFNMIFNRPDRELASDFEALLKSGDRVIVTPNDRAFIVSF